METPTSAEDFVEYIFYTVIFILTILKLMDIATGYPLAVLSFAFAVYRLQAKRTKEISDKHFENPKILQ